MAGFCTKCGRPLPENGICPCTQVEQPAPQPEQPQYQQPQYQPYQQQYQPAPAQPYVNPYKPVRPAPQPEPEPTPAPQPAYKAVPDDQWVNPFAPKREKAPEPQPEPTPAGGDAPASNVIARTSDEVMAMVEETVEKPAEVVEEAPEVAEAAEEPAASATVEEAASEEAVEEAPAEPEKPAQDEYVSPFDDPMGGDDDNTLTEYVPPVREKKERKPDNMVKPEMDTEGMTSYDPNFYRKRAEERKQRIAEAAGEAKHREEEKAAEPEYIDCKGPLEYTGEHEWPWKCSRCGQLFKKHEIPHKCVKTD